MKYLIVTIEGGGNVPPVLSVTRKLAAAGHQVFLLGEPWFKHLAQSTGATFIPFTEYFIKQDRVQDMFEDWKDKNNSFKNVLFGPARIVVRETVNAIQQFNIDVLIADVVVPTALMAAEVAKIPSVCLFHMPEYLPGPNRPPGGLGLTPGKNAVGRLRDKLLGTVFDKIFNKYLSDINSVRADWQLPPLKNVADLFRNCDLRLMQTSMHFDFPIIPAPVNVRYVGPVLDDPDWVLPWQNPWPSEDKRPLVVVALSSTFQNQFKALQNCIDALGKLSVRGLVTVGPAMANAQFNLPENVQLITSASHAQLFPHAACVITHAGHGTVMRALINGVPMVCLPMGRDQGDNAAKVVFHKTGLQCKANAAPGIIQKAVQQILSNPAYADNARKLGAVILADAQAGDSVAVLESIARKK